MANPTRFLIFFVVVHLSSINQYRAISAGNKNEVPFIRKSCNGVVFNDTCISVLEADPRSRTATDLKSLTRISMDIACEEANGLEAVLSKAGENVTDPLQKQNINDCIHGFNLCQHHVKNDGIPFFAKGEYGHAYFQVNFCSGGADGCIHSDIKMFGREIQTLYNFSVVVETFLNQLSS